MAQLASLFEPRDDRPTTNGRQPASRAARSSSSRAPTPHFAGTVNNHKSADSSQSQGYIGVRTNGEEDADELSSDSDRDDLSTTSGRRHGALLQPEIEDWPLLESPYMTHWNHKRHLTMGNPKPRDERDLPDWRMRERLRTVTAALVMCLNIGVDPPDVSKTNPCSKLICWMDPASLEVSKALPAIGKNLQAQFETLSMKTRYKQYLDPIVEETKRFCTSLRRTAKDERVLFYYNGYGVPKPTPGGEIWVFNKAYTQYIPVTLYDLQTWLGSPCICVWDASAAGNVIVNFKRLAERKADEEAKAAGKTREKPKAASSSSKEIPAHFPLRESIHLAACAPDEVLPMNPDLPADLFTCCLTSPIEISLRWFVLQNPLPSTLNVDMVMNIPGRLQDRRTPLGELNWIFTAITDTIAWTVLPRTIFRRLFRDDLMVAALLRNFLLAERIMRFYHCTPMSHPKLPPTHNHPLWDSWDLAVDQCLAQLPNLLAKERAQAEAAAGGPPVPLNLASFEYRHSTFFSEQLKAFEVWLSQGGVSRKRRQQSTAPSILRGPYTSSASWNDESEPVRDPPDQLPIVLQVLLSQVHRLRALILLSQFLDLGPWAVNLALSIGIFPYVLKLLQSPAADLKPVLIYIWARILAVDRSCQNDLLRDNGFIYFAGVLSPFSGSGAQQGGGGVAPLPPIPNVSEHRAMCAFILSVFCQDFPAGQQACLETETMDSCLEHLEDDDFLLRQWSALCLGHLWDDNEEGKARAIGKDAHGKLCTMLCDVSPEVRAAVLYALGTLLGTSGSSYDTIEAANASTNISGSRSPPTRRCLGTGSALDLPASKIRGLELGIAVTMLATKGDCNPVVRKELVIALSPCVREHIGFFVLAAYLYYQQEDASLHMRKTENRDPTELERAERSEALLSRVLSKLLVQDQLDEADIANVPAFTTIFVALLDLSVDSHPEVASLASTVVDYVLACMIESEVGRAADQILRGVLTGTSRRGTVTPTSTIAPDSYFTFVPKGADDGANGFSSANGHVTPGGARVPSSSHGGGGRRTASLAQTVKAIATLGYSRQSSPTGSEYDAASQQQNLSERVASSSPYSSGGMYYQQNGAPTPSRPQSAAQYVSPYSTSTISFDGRTGSGNASPTPSSPLAQTRSVAHRSASAESLAHIASRQRRATSSTSSPAAPRTPSLNTGAASVAASHESHYVQDNEKVAEALANLISVDLRRFRSRATVAATGRDTNGVASGTSSVGHTPMASPASSKVPRYSSNGTMTDSGPEIKEVIPLKSALFAWFSEYYIERQMKLAESDEQGSVKFNVQTWKRQRNERLVTEAHAQSEYASQTPWSSHGGFLANGAAPGLMIFHQFEDHLVIASEMDTISVWDWKKHRLLSRFKNGNPPRTNITSALFVNEDVDALLLVGSAEGDVRIYREYDQPANSYENTGPRLASTFRALPDLVRSKRPTGLILDWQQVTGHLLAAGDSHVIRVWDAHRELCVCDIPTRAASPVTSLSSELEIGHIFVAGFGDGTVGVYDRRNPPEASLVRLWEEHQTWVQKVHLQRRGNRELVSASVDGEVRLWDIRGRSSIEQHSLTSTLRGRLSCLAVHERVPIFAAASAPRMTRTGLGPQYLTLTHLESMTSVGRASPIVRNFSPLASSSGPTTPLSHAHVPGAPFPASDVPPSQFTPAMGAIAFHPHEALLAYGGPDAFVELRKCPPAPLSARLDMDDSVVAEAVYGAETIPAAPASSDGRRTSGTGWLPGW